MATAAGGEKPLSPVASNGNDEVGQPAPSGAGVLGGDEPEINKTHYSVLENAKMASTKEQSMTLWQGLKLYPKAIAYSVIISSCIVMEGYDISLVTNFCKTHRPILDLFKIWLTDNISRL